MNKISNIQFSLCAAALIAALGVAGCSKAPEAGSAEQAAPSATPAAAPVADATGMAEPLTQDQAGAEYRVAAEPVLVQNGEVVRTTVAVTNTGKVAINSQGKLPVNLAISLVDDAGNMVNREFVRVPLPAGGIAVGATVDIAADALAKDVAGKSLRFGLVQEGVAWFSDLNVATLDYGPLTSCEDQGKQTICGKDGKPLATVTSQ